MKHVFLPLILLLISSSASAMYTEMGVSYGLKTTSYDVSNDTKSESVTGSVSLYFSERWALELSYTEATAIENEKIIAGATTITNQTIVQKTEVYGADLIWMIADKSAFFQPYLKGGAAQINRTQQVNDKILSTVYSTPNVSGVAPDYGVGFKIQLSETFGIKISYDVQQTPLGNGTNSSDQSIRAGVTWVL